MECVKKTMNSSFKQALQFIEEVNGGREWPVGLVFVLPIFVIVPFLGLFDEKIELDFMIWGSPLLPIHFIPLYLLVIPAKYLFLLKTNHFGKDIPREKVRNIVRAFHAEMTGTILAVMFALLALTGPAIADPAFYWFVLVGGLTILPCYNILARYHLGQSAIINHIKKWLQKYKTSGAPFK